MERCVYAIPNDSVFNNDEITRLEGDVEASRVSPASLRTKLQVCYYPHKHANPYFLFLLLTYFSFFLSLIRRWHQD